jgi:putative tricarboxylic transport membrane protein
MAAGNMKEWLARRDANVWVSLFLMILAGAVASEAYRLEIGTPTEPGSGFMIFGASTLLGLLSLHLFIKSLLSREDPSKKTSEKIHRRRIIWVIAANVVYIYLLHPVGYLICTFVLLCFVFQIIERGRWASSLGGAALTSVGTYVVFAKLLQLNLPRGWLPFF